MYIPPKSMPENTIENTAMIKKSDMELSLAFLLKY